jgi:putative addiction module antidote
MAGITFVLLETDMVREVKVRRVGGSVGTTIPKDMAERLHVEPGDRLLAVETEHGILLTPFDPTTDKALAAATRIAKRYQKALRKLAK